MYLCVCLFFEGILFGVGLKGDRKETLTILDPALAHTHNGFSWKPKILVGPSVVGISFQGKPR